MATVVNARFIRSLPVDRSGGRIGVRVAPATQAYAWWWHANIQPKINSFGAASKTDVEGPRADAGWIWPWILAATSLDVTQGPRAFCVLVEGAGPNGFVPCTIIAMVRNVRAIDAPRARSAFLWYVASAPKDLLRPFVSKPPGMLGKAGLDVALCEAFRARREGRLALHADPKGGDELMKLYTDRHMLAHPKGAPLPFFVRGNVSDGRYFYYTPELALVALADHDPYR
jgi:hypothetical protein